MGDADPLQDLQAFIDERWAVAQPRFYPTAAGAPRVQPEVTATEARYFLAAVAPQGEEPPLLVVDKDRKERSDRYPRLADGSARGYLFFEEPGQVRLETIVSWAAMARLQDEFGWPREHIVIESPSLTDEHGRVAVRYEALDILLLEQPCGDLAATMPLAAARSRVGVEAKSNAVLLEKLIAEIRRCQAATVPSKHREHPKCLALAELRPALFLGVAASETWRLFTVVERDGRAILGDELPNLELLHFRTTSAGVT